MVIKNNKFEVLTTDGFKDFDGYKISTKNTILLKFDNNITLECTEDHLIYSLSKKDWIEAGLLYIGEKIEGDDERVLISISQCIEQEVVDLLNVQDTNSFIANGINVHNCLYWDEAAFISPRIQEDFYSSILPSLTAGGANAAKIIITSTPNGSEDLFSNIWFGSENGENGFTPIRIYNEDVPGRDENFKKEMLKTMSIIRYDIEYNCIFYSMKGTLIETSFIESMRSKPETISDALSGLTLYHDQDFNNMRLGLSADVSEGVGKDYSVIQIFNIDTLEQIGEYRNNTQTISDFTRYFIKVLEFLDKNGAKELYYTVESNPIGLSVLNLLENSSHSILKYAELISESGKKKKGILMTTKSKQKGCSKFKDLLETGKLKINSKNVISELKFFVKSKGSFAAENGKHDDLVMATIIFVLMLDEIALFDGEVYDTISKLDFIECVDDEYDEPMPIVF